MTALEEESGIRIISDTIATKLNNTGKFSIIPQIGGHRTKIGIPCLGTLFAS